MSFFDFIPVEMVSVAMTAVSTFFMYGLHQVTKHFKEKTKNERTKMALDMMDNLVTGAVKQTEQTLVQGLKDANEDGKLTPAEMRTLRNTVAEKVLKNATEQTKTEVLKVVPDLQSYVQTKIEETIHDIKISKTVTKIGLPQPMIDAVGNMAETTANSIIDETINAIKKPIPRELVNNFNLDK